MASLGKKLVTAFAYGNTVGFINYVIGELARNVLSASTPLGMIGYIVGLGSAFGIALAQDMKEDKEKKEGQ